MANGKDCEDKSSFDVYREGGSTREIRFTVQLVLVARRWRALLDEKLRPIDQSSARMEAMSAIMNSPGPNSQIDIAKRLRIEGPTMTRMIDALSRDGRTATHRSTGRSLQLCGARGGRRTLTVRVSSPPRPFVAWG